MLTFKSYYAWILAAFICAPAGSIAEQFDRLQITAIYDEPTTAVGSAILKEAYQRLGVDVSILITPSRRALMMADTGLADGDLFRIKRVAELFPNLVRVDHALFHGTLQAVVRKNDEHLLALPPERSRAVAVRRGIIISELTAQNMGMMPVYANSNEQALSLLESKRVDVALFTFVAQFSPLKPEELANFHIITEALEAFDLYHYLNRRHWKLAQILPEVLKQIEDEGIKDEILEGFRARTQNK
ncbi:transporter substrate-binding domain-containing protein [Marinobacter sp. S0848L]|uniref:transporter substrate-binding domain-containing protein n=1 Tax=Marinobacter sp. S0848L TaxID=2926423 RepID=UPI001FF384B6|nr:transporter substrate-binding domain-containing protein [Marinobacter sp. S0848L]MCK0105267.1 transporter substrate-binding domain-containing protein [Marinobacter sp. S0848L]